MTTGPALPIFADLACESEPTAISTMSSRVKSKLSMSWRLQGAVAVGDLAADRLARGERVDLVDGELQLLEDVQHLAADIARGADDRDAVAHLGSPE